MSRVSFSSSAHPIPASSGSDARGQLVDRVAQSRYIAKSARLRDFLDYICGRVIGQGVGEIHEQEVGHAVFGRARDYDTAVDNIVRVHASTLRKRLEQFFAEEGRDEPVIIELPKGNYAPIFRERVVPPLAAPSEEAVAPVHPRDARLLILAAIASLFALSTVFLLWRLQSSSRPLTQTVSLPGPVRDFWTGVFLPNKQTDIVLDDAAVGLYQELDGRPIALSEYFDRSYQRRLAEKPDLSSIAIKRQSSYSSVTLLWQFSRTAAALGSDWAPHFARDYAFRELKSNRAILLGNSRSNPWIEPFENRIGIHWIYDSAAGIYYPFDSWAPPGRQDQYRPGGEHPDGYGSISLLPNLGGTGSIIVLSGTGGAATASVGAFLMDGARMAQLRTKLPVGKAGVFPYFEALIKVPSRSRLAEDAEIVICRAARK